MAGEETTNDGNIKMEFNQATTGMNMDNSVNQVAKGMLTYALNASVENFDSNSVNYQNEPGNEWCLDFPTGFHLIGTHFINEQSKHIFFLTNPETGDSEIGYMLNNDCIYRTYISATCLNFNIKYPIHKAIHKITNCSTEIYWTDGYNDRRYLNLDDPTTVYTTVIGTDVCDNQTIPIIDCNKLKIQPNFEIPNLEVDKVSTGGSLLAGTYQFAIQYCDSVGDGYTSYYSVTNPTPVADVNITTPNFNYEVGRSIWLNITNIDITGYYKYYNLAVIKTINNITSVELVGTYFIDKSENRVIYTGQNQEQIKLTVDDIFEKFPYYNIAQDLTSVRDILVWDNLTTIDKINFQSIANQITLNWQTYKMPADENYADELNATNLRGYLRDEVYAFEIVFLLRDGKQTDGFHIPGRAITTTEASLPDIPEWNPDFVGTPDYIDPVTGVGYSPYWKIYNTASVTGPGVGDPIGNATPYQYGEFAYWESTDKYPCNDLVWGNLSNQPIRHHKFPDVLVSPIFESNTPTIVAGQYSVEMKNNNSVFPIGVKVDVSEVFTLIQQSNLTAEQKANIAAFKIVRGDRSTNKSIVAKGILRNVGQYKREETEYYYPNYPYNDLSPDPFINSTNNAFSVDASGWLIKVTSPGTYEYTDVNTGKIKRDDLPAVGTIFTKCSVTRPITITGGAIIGPSNYKIWRVSGCNGCEGYQATWNSPFTDNNSSYKTHVEYVQGVSSFNCQTIAGEDPFDQGNGSVITAIDTGVTDNTDTCDSGFFNWCRCHRDVTLIREVRDTTCAFNTPIDGFKNDSSKYRQVLNSPETSFGQPFLGRILKLENVMFGAGRGHFVQVNKNANYKLLSYEAQYDALTSSFAIAGTDITGAFTAYQAYLTIYINGITRRNYAWSFNSIANYDYTDIIDNDLGVKQRNIDLAQYLIPGVQSVGDNHNINNWNRESSVYIKTTDKDVLKEYKKYRICNTSTNPFTRPLLFQITDPVSGNAATVSVSFSTCSDVDSLTYPVVRGGLTNYTITILSVNYISSPILPLPFPNQTPSIQPGTSLISDYSRFTISSSNKCTSPGEIQNTIKVVSYYASLKNEFVNQWGQMYSYNTIDTGFQRNIEIQNLLNNTIASEATVFGGDTFISRFAFKTKLPFFIDNRVGAPDDSDIFYDEIGNIAYPKYWHSSRSILNNYSAPTTTLFNVISHKANYFDCPSDPATIPQGSSAGTARTFYDGYFYLFAYGIPNFYCESSVNVDLRQAFNNKEGDFWPHVSTDIPDDWFQESFVTIAQDNTYYYNVTFSKQNKENYFSHLPIDWTPLLCNTYFPFRAIYSDAQQSYTDDTVNSWLIYRPVSAFDFPQNYGKLTSLDGIQNKAVLARFENKSLLYNTLLTIDTSNPQAAYLGNDSLFKAAPPIDFAETDLGYVGSQNKMLLKIPQGQVTIDAKRGQVFLVEGIGGQATDLSAFGSGMNRFFTDHLAFEILRYFPKADTDNHFNGLGLHGVYDSKYDRIIISKLDYIPIDNRVKYDVITKEFYIETSPLDCPPESPVIIRTVVDLTDPEYFCNKSWTLSFNMNTKSWISFHSYIPNWYIAENNFFYSGLNGGCDLEAIAAEQIPYTTTTTSSSTTIPPLTTTTTTTATPLNCTLVGTAVGSNTPTTTTTTSSTTTTTTTICPTCTTYTIENTTEEIRVVNYTDCKTNLPASTNSDREIIHVCSCTIPTSEEDVTITEFGPGCTECFCFEVTNTSSEFSTNILYLNCSDVVTSRILNPDEVINICVKNEEISGLNISVTNGVSSCTSNDDCVPTTTTTTTLNVKCKCVTFENLCTVPSSYQYYNCIDELITGTLEVGEVLVVCGWGEEAGCEGVIMTEGPNCTNTPSCLSPEQICVQNWSKHNLAVTTLNDSTPIAYIAGGDPLWASTTSPAYCCPNDDCSPINIAAYGYLYNHYAVETGMLAPVGYHIPNDTEWNTLIDCLGGAAVAGDPLKTIGNDFWNSVNTGTNTSGFSAVGASRRNADGSFNTWNKYGNLWSSDGSSGSGNYVELQYDLSGVSSTTIGSNTGMSVRLIKD